MTGRVRLVDKSYKDVLKQSHWAAITGRLEKNAMYEVQRAEGFTAEESVWMGETMRGRLG
jgi:hypothetical protein